jgi:Amt family ammonium transporter
MSNLFRLAFLGVLSLSIRSAWADGVAAPTEPTLMGVDKISAGDTAWMLTSTALLLMMSIPGLALFYGGMVRKKNVLATLMQSFAIICMVTLLWWLIGYSWAFTPGSPFLGGASRAFFNGMTFVRDPTNKLSVSHLALTIPAAPRVPYSFSSKASP